MPLSHPFFLALLAAGVFWSGCKRPLEPEAEPAALVGTVVDGSGQPVPGVGVHYDFEWKPVAARLGDGGLARPLGSILVPFSLPKAGPVTLVLLDPLGREALRPLDGEVLPAGTHSVTMADSTLTNGFYQIVLSYGDTTVERRLWLRQSEIERLRGARPLTETDAAGRFELTTEVLGLNQRTPGPDGNTLAVSPTIEVVLIRAGRWLGQRTVTLSRTGRTEVKFQVQ